MKQGCAYLVEKLGLWVRHVVLRRFGDYAEAAYRNREAGRGPWGVCVCVVLFVRVRALMRVRVLMNPEFSFIRTYYHTTPIPTPTLATTPMHLWASSKTERLARLLKARGAATAVQMTPAMSMFMMLCM